MTEPVIFEQSRPGRRAYAQAPGEFASAAIPDHLRRKQRPRLPEVSELQTVRHFTRLSQMNYSIDTHFYPLGSCTMKYNPRACNQLAMLPGFLGRHPLGSVGERQPHLLLHPHGSRDAPRLSSAAIRKCAVKNHAGGRGNRAC